MNLLSRRQPRASKALSVDHGGFASEGAEPWRASWSNVRRVSAYKVDLLTVDEIRVEFAMQDGSIRVITEGEPGFAALMDQLVRHFPSASGWQGKVVHPPFASQHTVLYSSDE